jgi:hypothetical protein
LKTRQAQLKKPVVFDELEYDVLKELIEARQDELSIYDEDDEDFGPEINFLSSIITKLEAIK